MYIFLKTHRLQNLFEATLSFHKARQKATHAQNCPLVVPTQSTHQKAVLSHELTAICHWKMSPVKVIIIHRYQKCISCDCLEIQGTRFYTLELCVKY